MDTREEFVAHLSYLEGAIPSPELLPARLATACFEVLPIAAASISVFSSDGFRFPVGASCPRAAYAERLQFTTGEGPALDVRVDSANILADEAAVSHCWPLFQERLFAETPYRAVAAFPVQVSTDVWAAVDLYFTSGGQLQQLPLSDALAVVEIIGRRLADGVSRGRRWIDKPVDAARLKTAVAVGMLVTSRGSTVEEALSMLQVRAAAARITVDALSDAIVNQRLDLDDAGPRVSRTSAAPGARYAVPGHVNH